MPAHTLRLDSGAISAISYGRSAFQARLRPPVAVKNRSHDGKPALLDKPRHPPET